MGYVICYYMHSENIQLCNRLLLAQHLGIKLFRNVAMTETEKG